jgi:isopropylmalate/homocitrate/citramalate synthase
VTRVEIVEVGPRDGLQNAPVQLSPAQRADLCERLGAAGLTRIEAVSFVHPARVPRMAGAEDVVAALSDDVAARGVGLVLNERGLDRLLATRLPGVRFTLAVSDEFNRRNSNAPTAQLLAAARATLARARDAGLRTGVVLATSFGCPFAGEIDPGEAADVAAIVANADPDEIVFADTIGAAVPRQVRAVLERAAALEPPLGVHLHNTRNTGYANAHTAVEAGATILDTAVGGLGGCPFAPGATGNIATEDLAYMLAREGVDTGVDAEAVIETAHWLRDSTGLELDGQLHRVPRFPPPTTERP